jgi:acyl dehydratase
MSTVKTGDTLTPFTLEVTRESMKEWAVFLHDPNPIHLDAEVVKAKGLGEKEINQGPTNVAYIINMLHNNFPGATIESVDSRFLDNVYADDLIETYGTVTDVTVNDGATQVSCDIGLRVEGRGDVISGTAILTLNQ